MGLRTVLFLMLFAFMLGCTKESGNKEPEISSESQKAEIVASHLRVPWSIDFLPTGELIFTQRGGTVSILSKGEIRNISIPKTAETSEGGLLGIAVHPKYAENRYVYLYYTYRDFNSRLTNRLSRFILENYSLQSEKILLDYIPAAQNHNGGRIKFGPDGKIYAANGDAQDGSDAQDLSSIAGKILRLNDDGTIPGDNPFPGSAVYTYGHRNPEGLAWHTLGKMFESEHGASSNDEVNLIEAGKNYGWPNIQCSEKEGHAVSCISDFTLAPGGMAFHGNDLYVAGLRGAQVRKFSFDKDASKVVSQEVFLSGFGRIRDVVEKDGYLYVATSNHDGRGIPALDDDKILRVKLGE